MRSIPTRSNSIRSIAALPVLPLAVVLLLGLLSGGSGCAPSASEGAGVQFDLSLVPSPPEVGDADVSLKLADAEGSPIEGAAVRLEGNMNHAGMKPSFADLLELEPGRYTGKLKFTMGGDWFVLVNVRTSDGQDVQRKVDVPGVKAT